MRSLSSRKSVAFQKSFPVTDKAFSYGFYNASLFFIYYIPILIKPYPAAKVIARRIIKAKNSLRGR